MRFGYTYIKKIIWICVAMLFLVSIHILSVYIFAVHQFTISYDDVLSEKAQDVIEDYIRVSRCYNLSAPELLAQQLQKQFPFIRKVTCVYAPLGLYIKVKSHEPFLHLLDDRVVVVNNYCLSQDYFVVSAYDSLPLLHASIECDNLPIDMFDYLKLIDLSLFKRGAIRWHHTNEVVFDMQGEAMRLICNYEKKPTREIITQCLELEQDLKSQQFLANNFSMDIRFADRIVVAKLRNEEALR